MTQKTAIIFDMDGLMVDTEPLAQQAWAQLLAQYDYTLEDEMYQRMIGWRSDVSAQIALDTFDLPLTAAELVRRKEAIFDGLRANGVPVMSGLMALQAQIARRNLPWAVATSSPRHHAHIVLAQLGLTAACRAIAAGDEVVNSKPSPDIYLLAAQRLNIPPAHCLALEDSGPGSQAAVAAGMTAVAIPNGQTKTADFSHAHYVFNSLHDVVDNLDRLLQCL